MAEHHTDGIHLSQILTPDRVLIRDSGEKEEMLTELIELMSSAPEITDVQAFRQGIFQREELMSTGIGLEIGVPHVRLRSIKNVVMALGICRNGIFDYESIDNTPVRIVCMIGAHESQHQQYIKTLSRVSERLKDDDIHDALIDTSDPEEAFRIFTGET